MHRLTIILMALAGTSLLSGLNYQRAICATPPGKPVAIPTTAQPGDQAAQARVLGAKAYVWGYPLVISAATALVGTNTDKPLPNGHAPFNQFGNVAKLFTAADTDVVSSNVDTVYSSAFLDLKAGAALVSVPDSHGRYYALMLEDAYTNIFGYIGKRATGTKSGRYLIAGPGWKGTAPAGVPVIDAPTSFVWIIGRTLVDNEADLANVRAIQAGYNLKMLPPAIDATPIKARWDLSFNPKLPPVATVNGLGWKAYYTWLGQLVKDNPPPATDSALLASFSAIGISTEHGFEPGKLAPAVLAALSMGYDDGKTAVMKAALNSGATEVNGWAYNLDAGKWGQNYELRASIAYRSLGQNTAEEAIYFNSRQDAEKAKLNGNNRYTLTFAKGQTPPVNAFWSITMYNASNFFVANSIGRLAIGNRTPGLRPNTDGSLTIYVQKANPGGTKTSNWLPAPDGDFRLSMRLYNPRPEVLRGDWTPPAINLVP